MLESLGEFLVQGGFVMPFLAGSLLALWYALGYRAVLLRRGTREPLRPLVARAETGPLSGDGVMPRAVRAALAALPGSAADPRSHVEEALEPIRADLDGHRALVKMIVVTAPLAGLLGTVTGMIETFDSLGDMALYTQGGGIAAGISQALVTTQMGLAVAIPGLILGGLLSARQTRLEDELTELAELLCARVGGAV